MPILEFRWDYRVAPEVNVAALRGIMIHNVARMQTAINFYNGEEVKRRATELFHFVKGHERILQGMLERGELR